MSEAETLLKKLKGDTGEKAENIDELEFQIGILLYRARLGAPLGTVSVCRRTRSSRCPGSLLPTLARRLSRPGTFACVAYGTPIRRSSSASLRPHSVPPIEDKWGIYKKESGG